MGDSMIDIYKDFLVEETINDDNLSISDINKFVKRPRAIIINSSNKALIGYASLTTHFEFPGGHLEGDETLDEALIREVREETGIDLTNDKFYPFFHLQYLCKNFPEKNVNTSIEFFYYVVYTDKKVNMANSHLDTGEQNEKFAVSFIPIEEIEGILEENLVKSKELNTAARDIHHIWQSFISNIDTIKERRQK